ncbi:MAG: hypothetical protein KJ626_01400, partial [Verrucomicrobia bacterium]|nr:hypothetical protein [Verrucomicrobiota bacterium]
NPAMVEPIPEDEMPAEMRPEAEEGYIPPPAPVSEEAEIVIEETVPQIVEEVPEGYLIPGRDSVAAEEAEEADVVSMNALAEPVPPVAEEPQPEKKSKKKSRKTRIASSDEDLNAPVGW